MNRMQFLYLLGGCLFAKSGSIAARIVPTGKYLTIEALSRSMFEAHLNSRFWLLKPSGESVAAELVDVSDGITGKNNVLSSKREQRFSLLFRCSNDTELSSSIHTLVHPRLGCCDLFLSPVCQNTDWRYVEIVVNRVDG